MPFKVKKNIVLFYSINNLLENTFIMYPNRLQDIVNLYEKTQNKYKRKANDQGSC